MSKQDAVLDLPPAPPAYVKVVQELSARSSKEIIETLKHVTSRGDGHEPPHDHVEEPPPPAEREPVPAGQSLGMEVPRWRWKKHLELWALHAQQMQLINQSGMDSTLPMVPGTDKETV
jgi:hypothetical protein